MLIILKLFKDLRIKYWITALFGATALGVITAFLLHNESLALLLMILWILGCAIFYNKSANKRYLEIFSLRDNCHIAEYNRKFNKLLLEVKGKSNRDLISLNLFAGYFEIGDFATAQRILFDFQPFFPENNSGILAKCVYHSDLCTFYIYNDELDKAETALNDFKIALENDKLPEPLRDTPRKVWKQKRILLDMAKGDFDGAEKFFLLELSSEKALLAKVSANFNLAKIYLHYGNTEKARKCCRYIIENGGDTFYVGWAKEKID